MKYKKLRKGVIVVGTLIPIVAVSTGLYFYYHSKKESTQNIIHSSQKSGSHQTSTTNETNDIYDKVKIFPQLNYDILYPYVRMKDGKYIITDDFISAVINYVISHMKVTDGNLHYKYELPTPSSLKITFYWSKPNTKEYWMTYTANVSM